MAVLQKICFFVALAAIFSASEAGSSSSGSSEALNLDQLSQALPGLLSSLGVSPQETQVITDIFTQLVQDARSNSRRRRSSSSSSAESGEGGAVDLAQINTLLQNLLTATGVDPANLAIFTQLFDQLTQSTRTKRSSSSSGSGSFGGLDIDVDAVKGILENLLTSFGVDQAGISAFSQFFDGLSQGGFAKRSSSSSGSGSGGIDVAALQPTLTQLLDSFGVSATNQDLFVQLFNLLLDN